ncbi:MAG: leucine-rich repeat domain-containing protein, partial [Muribaculaceae bacterium]|nr:leucine-rich repeat domain-containing protein [Muribaculaceae bacterium]
PWRIATAAAGTDSAYRYVDNGCLASVKDYRTMAPLNASSDDDMDCQVIHTSAYGQLGELLGEHLLTVDSLVVYGPVDSTDIEVMWRASFEGQLKFLNLENATVKGRRIPDKAFWHQSEQLSPSGEYIYCIKLRRMILPNDVEEIGEGVFSWAVNLEYINFPDSLKSIDRYAFSYCRSFKADPVVFPEGMETIGSLVFLDCWSFTGKVVLPSTLKTLGLGAFFSSKITECIFSEGLEEVGDAAFYGTRLKEAILPNSIQTFVGSDHFAVNYELEKIRFPEGVTTIPKGFVDACIELTEFIMPNSVEEIGSGAFHMCDALEELQLSSNLKSLDSEALASCRGLKTISFPATLETLGAKSCDGWHVESIYCEAPVPPVCLYREASPDHTPFGKYVEGSANGIPVYVPVGSAELYRNAWGWNYFTNFIEMEFSGVEDCVIEKDDTHSALYDLQGRKVSQPISGRVYIQNGKKVVLSE